MFIPPEPESFSYLIFVDKVRVRYDGESWSEWTYRSDNVYLTNGKRRIIATGARGFADKTAGLQGITSFQILRKKSRPFTKSWPDYSEQVSLPDDEELAELEVLIRGAIEEKQRKESEMIDLKVARKSSKAG